MICPNFLNIIIIIISVRVVFMKNSNILLVYKKLGN